MFEWNIFPAHPTLYLLQEFQELMEKELKIQPESFEGRIIFMSMYNDIDWTIKGNQQACEENSSPLSHYARKFTRGHWSFLRLGDEEEWYATLAYKPNGAWNRVAENMMITFAESGHLVFRGSSPLSRGALKRTGGGKTTIHDNAEPQTAVLF